MFCQRKKLKQTNKLYLRLKSLFHVIDSQNAREVKERVYIYCLYPH